MCFKLCLLVPAGWGTVHASSTSTRPAHAPFLHVSHAGLQGAHPRIPMRTYTSGYMLWVAFVWAHAQLWHIHRVGGLCRAYVCMTGQGVGMTGQGWLRCELWLGGVLVLLVPIPCTRAVVRAQISAFWRAR